MEYKLLKNEELISFKKRLEDEFNEKRKEMAEIYANMKKISQEYLKIDEVIKERNIDERQYRN